VVNSIQVARRLQYEIVDEDPFSFFKWKWEVGRKEAERFFVGAGEA
jgi:hypothetical protein